MTKRDRYAIHYQKKSLRKKNNKVLLLLFGGRPVPSSLILYNDLYKMRRQKQEAGNASTPTRRKTNNCKEEHFFLSWDCLSLNQREQILYQLVVVVKDEKLSLFKKFSFSSFSSSSVFLVGCLFLCHTFIHVAGNCIVVGVLCFAFFCFVGGCVSLWYSPPSYQITPQNELSRTEMYI